MLLSRILRSDSCQASIHSLNVLVNHCVSTRIFSYDSKRKLFTLEVAAEKVGHPTSIHDVQVLKTLLLDCWKTWVRVSKDQVHEVVVDPKGKTCQFKTCIDIVLTICIGLMDDNNPVR